MNFFLEKRDSHSYTCVYIGGSYRKISFPSLSLYRVFVYVGSKSITALLMYLLWFTVTIVAVYNKFPFHFCITVVEW